MEAATKNKKRGRPKIFDNDLYAIFQDDEKRTAQNKYYVGYTTTQIMKEKPGGFFVTAKGNFRRQGIAEQIGRMAIRDGYTDSDCKKIAEKAIELFGKGYSCKAIEAWIRNGRKTNEW